MTLPITVPVARQSQTQMRVRSSSRTVTTSQRSRTSPLPNRKFLSFQLDACELLRGSDTLAKPLTRQDRSRQCRTTCFVEDDSPPSGPGGFQRLGGTDRISLSMNGALLSNDGTVMFPNEDYEHKTSDGDGGAGGKGRGFGGGGGGDGGGDQGEHGEHMTWWFYMPVILVVYAAMFALVLLAMVRSIASAIRHNTLRLRDQSSVHLRPALEAVRRGLGHVETMFGQAWRTVQECNPVPCLFMGMAGMVTMQRVLSGGNSGAVV